MSQGVCGEHQSNQEQNKFLKYSKKKKKSLKEFECYTREDSLNAKENSNGEQRNKDVKQTKQNEVAKIKINYVKNNINVNGLNNYSKGRTLEKMRSNHTLSNEDTVDSKI